MYSRVYPGGLGRRHIQGCGIPPYTTRAYTGWYTSLYTLGIHHLGRYPSLYTLGIHHLRYTLGYTRIYTTLGTPWAIPVYIHHLRYTLGYTRVIHPLRYTLGYTRVNLLWEKPLRRELFPLWENG